MSPPHVPHPHVHDRRVTFPDLVRIHYRWRQLVDSDSTSSAEEREAVDEEYHAALAKFEAEHGELVNVYWCADFESAVALTAGKPNTGWLRRLLSVPPKFHRVSDWATKDDPEIARLLHKCDELAIRARGQAAADAKTAAKPAAKSASKPTAPSAVGSGKDADSGVAVD